MYKRQSVTIVQVVTIVYGEVSFFEVELSSLPGWQLLKRLKAKDRMGRAHWMRIFIR